MILDKNFQDKFFEYLNKLSKEEIVNEINNPSVKLDFLVNKDIVGLVDVKDYLN